MSTVNVRPTNGVSFGVNYTVTATDQSDTYVIFDFTAVPVTAGVTGTFPYNLVTNFILLDSSNAVITNVGAVVTYPVKGQIKIANGGSVTLTAGQKIQLIVQHS